MTFTITIGTWIVPLVVTVILLAWAMPLREDERGSGFFGPLSALSAVFRTGCAVVLSLVFCLR